jgi:hypothetical protein
MLAEKHYGDIIEDGSSFDNLLINSTLIVPLRCNERLNIIFLN